MLTLLEFVANLRIGPGLGRTIANSNQFSATCGRERMVYIHDFDDSLNVNFPVQGKDISELRFAKEDLLVVATLSGEISAFKLHRCVAVLDFVSDRCEKEPKIHWSMHSLQSISTRCQSSCLQSAPPRSSISCLRSGCQSARCTFHLSRS